MGFFIFSCLLIVDFLNIFKELIGFFNMKMINLLKFMVFLLIFLGFVGFLFKMEKNEKKYEIIMGVCGTLMGFFLANMFGKELKKFCTKTF